MQRADQTIQLEQRIKSLEYEMKILKSEVQRTLLDIQEQILVHYYPTLRAEDASPSKDVVQTFESLRGRRGEVQQDEAQPLPVTKKISLEEAKTVQTLPSAAGEPEQGSLVELSKWVTDGVASLGKKRTIQLLEAYAVRGFLTSDFKSVLVRLASLSNENQPPKEISVNEMLNALMELDGLLGRHASPEEAISLIEEVGIG
jgi:hypothetical protein